MTQGSTFKPFTASSSCAACCSVSAFFFAGGLPWALSLRDGSFATAPASSAASKICFKIRTVSFCDRRLLSARVARTSSRSSRVTSRSSFAPITGQITLLIWN